jgi:phosphate butyryltransferase
MTRITNTFDELLVCASGIKGKRVAVAYANNKETFVAIALAQKKFDLSFMLTGDKEFIRKGLNEAAANITSIDIDHCPDPKIAAQTTIGYIRNGNADILLKGSIDTATLMKMVLLEENGLRTGRLLSDVFIFEYPERRENKLIMITDGGLNLIPGINEKIDLIHNAIAVAHALGHSQPKVAILSASEFVNPKLPSSVDAESLVQMNQRGQLVGCIIGGPLALDSALWLDAAQEKGIDSPVAGRAEILIAPNIETANALAKSTTYFAHLRLAHVIVGAKVPILITSRADKSDAKLLSIALGLVMSEYAG